MDGGDLWTLMTLPHKVERLVCATDRALESKLVAEIIIHATALTTARKRRHQIFGFPLSKNNYWTYVHLLK